MVISEAIKKLEHFLKQGDDNIEVYLKQDELCLPIKEIIEETYQPPSRHEGEIERTYPLERNIYIEVEG